MPPRERVLSPTGGSTLMTSAPSCARIMPQVGPITMWVISTTLTPSSGSPVPVIIFSLTRQVFRRPRLGFRDLWGKHNLPNGAFTVA